MKLVAIIEYLRKHLKMVVRICCVLLAILVLEVCPKPDIRFAPGSEPTLTKAKPGFHSPVRVLT